jgi:prepilin-type N-terminal cleavage/methylation domain-containing protein
MLKQRGVTLIEMVVALGIMAAIATWVAVMLDDNSRDTKAAITASHGVTVAAAGVNYIKDNYSTLAAVASDTTPALIRISDLVAAGYLQDGFSITNPRLQVGCILVLEPTPNKLAGMLVYEGGDVIDDLTLGQIASLIGGSGGGIYSTDVTVVRGAMSGWTMPIANYANPNHLGQRCDGSGGDVTFSAGHPAVALWLSENASSSPTLYRDEIPGNPSLNTMNTPILMGAGSIQIVGEACATDGALARDENGGVISCVNNAWKAAGGSQYWQDPVPTFAALPVCNAASINQTRVVEAPTVGTGRRAYTCNGAGTWNALGVDNNGNIAVAGIATINTLNVSGNSTFSGSLTVGDGTAATASNTLVVNRTATLNAACSPNGAVARDSVGLLLSCQSGLWKKAFGDTLHEVGLEFIDRLGPWNVDNDFVKQKAAVSSCGSSAYPAYPACDSGFTVAATRRFTQTGSCTVGSITYNTTRYYSATSCVIN